MLRRSYLSLAIGCLLAGPGCGGVAPASPPGAITRVGPVAAVDAGTGPDAGLPSAACTPATGARMIAPISGSTVTMSTVRLQIEPAGAAGVDVQVCHDRPCALVAWDQAIAGREVTTPWLQPGYWFWRVRETGAGDSAWSSVWEFRIRPRPPGYQPTANVAAELFRDVNGDGYPDATLYGATDATVCLGGPGALSPERLVQIPGGASAARAIPVGDMDGDGAGELAWLTNQGGWIVRGCSGGPALDFALPLPCTNCLAGTVVSGDITGDGLWDAVYADGQVTVALGAPRPPTTAAGSPPPLSPGTGALMMDLNGDGYSDLYVMQGSGNFQLFFGGARGLIRPANPGLPVGIDGFGDFDGDGYLDVASWTIGQVGYGGVPSYDGGPLFGPTAHSAEIPVAQAGAVVDLDADGYDDLVLLVAGAGVEFLQGTPSGLAQPVVVPAPAPQD